MPTEAGDLFDLGGRTGTNVIDDRLAHRSPVLTVTGLSTQFVDPTAGPVLAVRDFTLSVRPGETVGLVGESGSGKSVSLLSVLGLVRYTGGRVVSGTAIFEGKDLLTMSRREMRAVRGRRIGMIFQDPMTSLNPVMTIGRQLAEPLRKHLGLSASAAKKRSLELLDMVRIPDARHRLRSYPHELSGGMRQRVMIALALACDPVLLVADEPTTALDVTVQAQILELIREASRERNMAVVLISHDLGVIAGLADRVSVMYFGSMVESGSVRQVLKHTRHPYTLGLLRSSPRIDREPQRILDAIPGSPPELDAAIAGCAFRPRCPFAVDRCATDSPPLRLAADSAPENPQLTACWVDLHDRSVFASVAEVAP
jgi:oligopeptide/dipeptide ABC transporter ATP-binding protein